MKSGTFHKLDDKYIFTKKSLTDFMYSVCTEHFGIGTEEHEEEGFAELIDCILDDLEKEADEKQTKGIFTLEEQQQILDFAKYRQDDIELDIENFGDLAFILPKLGKSNET